MAVATYEDVAVPLGRAIDTALEQGQVTWWLDGTERIIRSRLGDITLLDQGDLAYVEAEVVAEKVRRNGRAESSTTVVLDDGTVTRRFENQISAGDITDEWWDLLAGTGSRRSSSRMGWLL